jgi:hypothetical protein
MINEGQDEGGNNGEDIVELMEKAIEKAKLEIGRAVSVIQTPGGGVVKRD